VAAIVDAPVRSRRSLAAGGAVFLVLSALVAAWIVLPDRGEPAPLGVERTVDGDGLVVSGAVPTPDDLAELLDVLGRLTDAPVIVSEVTVDSQAEVPGSIEQAARRLARSLTDGTD